ncbi:hypothetical protein D3C86_1792620 [compost metagenome]
MLLVSVPVPPVPPVPPMPALLPEPFEPLVPLVPIDVDPLPLAQPPSTMSEPSNADRAMCFANV